MLLYMQSQLRCLLGEHQLLLIQPVRLRLQLHRLDNEG
jgi:hypothetical protein